MHKEYFYTPSYNLINTIHSRGPSRNKDDIIWVIRIFRSTARHCDSKMAQHLYSLAKNLKKSLSHGHPIHN